MADEAYNTQGSRIGINAGKSSDDIAAAGSTAGSAAGLGAQVKSSNPRPRKQRKDESTQDFMAYISGWRGRGSPDESDQDEPKSKAMTSAMASLPRK